MEVYDPPRKDFMARFERYEPVVQDHSAVIQAKQCKRKFFFRVVLGFVERVQPQYFGFGSCYHKFREVLEKAFLEADPKIRLDLEAQATWCAEAINAATALWKKKRMTDPPVGTKWDFQTQSRLIQSCITAFKHWQEEKRKGRIEVLAVEQNFAVPLGDTGIIVAGKADQILRWNGKTWGRDFKTSSKTQDKFYVRTLDPNDQFTRYTWGESELAGMQLEGQIVEVLFNAKDTKKGPKGPEIHTHLATRSRHQIERWVKEQTFYNRILTLMRDEDCYPMEERSCPFCEFHSVCVKGSERAMMAKLEAEFKREPWNCMQRADVDD